MIKKIIAIVAFLLMGTISANAELVTWSDFDLVWNDANASGGVVTIQSQEGLGSFEAEVINFAESYYWTGGGSPPPVERFLSPKKGSEVNFEPWMMFIDTMELPGQWNASFIGTGYDLGSPFTVTKFREANWQIDDNRPVSTIPEPATWFMLLLGIFSLVFMTKKRQLPKKVRYAS